MIQVRRRFDFCCSKRFIVGDFRRSKRVAMAPEVRRSVAEAEDRRRHLNAQCPPARGRYFIERSTVGTTRSAGSVISNNSAGLNAIELATIFEGNVSRVVL